jgi:hypothetical protein
VVVVVMMMVIVVVFVARLGHADADWTFDGDEAEEALHDAFFDAVLGDAFACCACRGWRVVVGC